jgi:hypothetical protein
VTSNAAIPDELAHEIPKAMKEIGQDIEVNFLEDNDGREDNRVDGYLTRAVGSWVNASEQSLYPVDSNFRPPSASINTTAWSAIAEDEFRAVLTSIWEQSKSSEMISAFAGSSAVRGIQDWQYRTPSSTAASPVVNAAVKVSFKDKTITRGVRRYEGDFMDVEVVPTPWLVYLTGSGGCICCTARSGRCAGTRSRGCISPSSREAATRPSWTRCSCSCARTRRPKGR